jgi:uncharacterized protein (DUF983 family)
MLEVKLTDFELCPACKEAVLFKKNNTTLKRCTKCNAIIDDKNNIRLKGDY